MTDATNHRREEGSALLIVLWIVMAGALLVTSFNSSVKSSTNLLSTERAIARHRALFETGLSLAVSNMLVSAEDLRWPQDGSSQSFTYEGNHYTVRIFDENGKVDLNYADSKLLTALFRSVTGSPSLAASLKQAVEARRPGKKKLGDDQRREGFLFASQLRELPGMTAPVYRKLAPLVSVYGSNPKINPMTASQDVLLSVPGLRKSDAARIMELRRGGRAILNADAALKERFSKWLSIISGPAYTISIKIDARDGREPKTSSATILLRKKDKIPFRILAWNVL